MWTPQHVGLSKDGLDMQQEVSTAPQIHALATKRTMLCSLSSLSTCLFLGKFALRQVHVIYLQSLLNDIEEGLTIFGQCFAHD